MSDKKSYNRPLEHKEYLKLKYLSGSVEEEKKKNRKKKIIKKAIKQKKVRIFDDDIDLKNIDTNVSDDELYYGTKEEKPMVAAVVDERPLHMRRNDIDTNRWKTIGSCNDEEADKTENDNSTNSRDKRSQSIELNENSVPKQSNSGEHLSPPRESVKKLRHDSDSDLSPVRPEERKDDDSRAQSSKSKRHDSDSDLSPPRTKSRTSDSSKVQSLKSKKHDSDNDLSPPRTKPRIDDSSKAQSSKSKRHDSDSDLSPPRTKSRIDDSSKARRHDSDSDLSPPRETNNTSKSYSRQYSSRDSKVSSRNQSQYDRDFSPPRHKSRKTDKISSDTRSESKRHDSDSDLSPPRVNKDQNPHKKSNEPKKSELTLSGKRAGLSDAKELRDELMSIKKKEQNLFASISDEMLGKNAKTVFRDSKSGRIRDLEEEARLKYKEDSIKEKIDSEKKAKYEKWSKGLIQVGQQEERLQSDLHEMSKPLARYEDDDDLDKLLREREREDDPMLATIRKNKAKHRSKDEKSSLKVKPTYNGPAPPLNRFQVMPGYRWDGVDRSNGFEKKYFERISSKESAIEEAYRWSTQDM